MSEAKTTGLESVPTGALQMWISNAYSSINRLEKQIKEKKNLIDLWQKEVNNREQ